MSWDIFIQDLPKGIKKIDDMPEDFAPKPLGTSKHVRARLQEAVPGLRFDAGGNATVNVEDGGSVEFTVGPGSVESVMLAVRGEGKLVVGLVAAIVNALGGSALDTASKSGIWDQTKAMKSFAAWQAYRDASIASISSPAKTIASTSRATAKKSTKAKAKAGPAKPPASAARSSRAKSRARPSSPRSGVRSRSGSRAAKRRRS